MHSIRISTHFLAVMGMLLTPPATAMAQTVPVQDAADIVINMRGVEIADVAEQISRITGRTLILDPAVKGVVTVTSAQPLTREGVWELFQSVLRANGFAAVRSGRSWRIVPQASAVRDGGAPTRSTAGQELTTRMIRLSNVPAGEAARVVRPLVANFGSVEPLTSPNAIVVTDYADNVRRIEAIVRQLDGDGGSSFATITLRHGNAAQVAESLQNVMGGGNGEQTVGATRIAADTRSNVVIVRGTPAAVAEARRIAASLDEPGGATPVTRVFRLSYADAESVTEVLRGTLGIESEATNPVARSLSGNGSTRISPTRALSNLTSAGSADANDMDAASQAASGQISATRAETPAGFSTPDVTVQPAPDINAIVVRGTPAMMATIEELLAELDVRRPQVLIEAAIAEITGDDAESLAVQLGTSGAVLDDIEGAGTSFSTPGPSLGTILTLLGVPAGSLLGDGFSGNVAIGDDFSILVQALATSTRANLLSTPQITVVDNGMGEFVAAQEVPFVTGSILTSDSGATPYTTIERKDVGITLRVLPRINAGDTIRLDVTQEASSISPVQLSSASDIITNKRSVTTTVLADNGSTIVLGGLTSDNYQQVISAVPILGQIPIIGELFRSRQESHDKRTLFIFLKPTILRTGEDASAAAADRYARLRAEEQENREHHSMLLRPPAPRLKVEIDGIY